MRKGRSHALHSSTKAGREDDNKEPKTVPRAPDCVECPYLGVTLTMVLWRSASGGLRCPLPLVSVAALQLVPVLGSSQLFGAQADNSSVAVPLSNVSTIGSRDHLDVENGTKPWNVHDRQGHTATTSSEWDEFRLDQALFIYVIAGLCFVIMLVLGLKYVICDKNLKILKRTRTEVLRKAGYRQPVEFSSTGRLMVSAKV